MKGWLHALSSTGIASPSRVVTADLPTNPPTTRRPQIGRGPGGGSGKRSPFGTRQKASPSYLAGGARQPTPTPPRYDCLFGWRPPPKRSMLEEGLVWKGNSVIILGIICIIVGLLVASLKILLWVGIALLVVGLILNFVPIGGRRRRIF